jgi:8-oxo-dGTP pyrophosphatase MutT (NUDIX family)
MATEANWVRQAAAIPLKADKICMVTSSSGKRWVVPKGMIDPGKNAGEAALQEAWEEAGLVGVLEPAPIGSYIYEKWGNKHHVTVFVMRVTEAAEDWPEREVRERCWLSIRQALVRIEDEGLREVVRKAIA